MTKSGRVYIIGAGPGGDQWLMTVRGVACIAEAEVIVYVDLTALEITGHAGKGARLVYAGKHGGEHHLSQAQINYILVAEASSEPWLG